MTHYEKYTKKSNRTVKINPKELESWGNKKGRGFVLSHNQDKNSPMKGDYKNRITRIDHSKQCRDVVTFMAKSNKRRKSE